MFNYSGANLRLVLHPALAKEVSERKINILVPGDLHDTAGTSLFGQALRLATLALIPLLRPTPYGRIYMGLSGKTVSLFAGVQPAS
jgi:hypothetical protein